MPDNSPAYANLFDGGVLDLGDLKVQGVSLSGVRTAFTLPELRCAFDVAQGYPFSFTQDHFFISHTHMDHAAGIPYLISQKTMYHHKPANFYMPSSMIEGMHDIMRSWAKLEGHTYQYNFLPVDENFQLSLNPHTLIRSFPTIHRVPSFGYTVFRVNKKLKKEFSGLSEDQLRDLRRGGTVIQEQIESPQFSFTGDTQIEFLDSKPWVRKSKYLLLESTYLDQSKSVAHARQWGHTHLDEILPELSNIQAEKIVLIHVSSRYSTGKARDVLSRRLPINERERVILFPER